MELVTLNENLRVEDPIENFKSLIWTERYSTFGDFELQSNDISGCIKLLALDSFVSLRDSASVCVVETHKISKPAREAPFITVTGSSFETVLERRASTNQPLPATTTKPAFTVDAAKESDAAYLAMRIVLGDIGRSRNGTTQILAPIAPASSPLDAIPEIDLTLPADFVDVAGTGVWQLATVYGLGELVKLDKKIYKALGPSLAASPDTNPDRWEYISDWSTYVIKTADLYSTVMELITTNHHGLKTVRPIDGDTQFGVEIYNGADLTDTVRFDVRFDQFDSATYFLSKKGSAQIAYAYGPGGSEVVTKTTAPEPSGLARRVVPVDVTGEASANSTAGRRNRALIELYQRNNTAFFDGQLAAQLALGYNKKYFLGDIVQLVGDYDLSQNVRVSEFIRSSDNTGEKSYPTFEAVDNF